MRTRWSCVASANESPNADTLLETTGYPYGFATIAGKGVPLAYPRRKPVPRKGECCEKEISSGPVWTNNDIYTKA